MLFTTDAIHNWCYSQLMLAIHNCCYPQLICYSQLILFTTDAIHNWCYSQLMLFTTFAIHNWCYSQLMLFTTDAIHNFCYSQLMLAIHNCCYPQLIRNSQLMLFTTDAIHNWCYSQLMLAIHDWCYLQLLLFTTDAIHNWCYSQLICYSQLMLFTTDAIHNWYAIHNWCHSQLMLFATDAIHNWCHSQLMPFTTDAIYNWCHSQLMLFTTDTPQTNGLNPNQETEKCHWLKKKKKVILYMKIKRFKIIGDTLIDICVLNRITSLIYFCIQRYLLQSIFGALAASCRCWCRFGRRKCIYFDSYIDCILHFNYCYQVNCIFLLNICEQKMLVTVFKYYLKQNLSASKFKWEINGFTILIWYSFICFSNRIYCFTVNCPFINLLIFSDCFCRCNEWRNQILQ